jgi:hypothetical protein
MGRKAGQIKTTRRRRRNCDTERAERNRNVIKVAREVTNKRCTSKAGYRERSVKNEHFPSTNCVNTI